VYAPIGSLKRGENLVTTGGEAIVDGTSVPGVTQACATCHGVGLTGGVGAMPPIAGRSASYLARALYDIKLGTRSGVAAQIMMPTVQKLSEDDVIAIVGYVASLEP